MNYLRGLKRRELFFWTANVIFAVVCVLSCLFHRNNYVYKYVYLLPAGYLLVFILFSVNVKGIFDDYVKLIVYMLYFVKDVFTVLLLSFGGYSTQFYRITQEGVNFAVALMIYEFFCISLLYYPNKKISNKISFTKLSVKGIKHTGNAIIYLILIFCAIAYCMVPSIRESYGSILDIFSVVRMSGENNNEVGSIYRIAYTLFVMLFQITLVLFISTIFSRIRRIYGDNSIGIILCCICLIIPTLFIPEETGFFLILMVTLVLVICKLFPVNRGKFIRICIVFFVIAVSLIYVAKTATTGLKLNTISLMGNMFQAYFPGVANTAGIYDFNGSVKKLTQWFYEVYNAVPFKTTLFGVVFDRVVVDYCRYNGVYYQIMPCIGQAYYFWGFALAPIEPILLIKLSKFFYDKAKKENNTLRYTTYTLIALYAALTTGMYNMTAFFSRFVNTFVPMLIIVGIRGDTSYDYLEMEKNKSIEHY